MPNKTLHEIHHSARDKVSDKWELYLQEYDTLFRRYRDEPVTLLEIGVQNGGSLDVWAGYFTHASHVLGCDIDPNCGGLVYTDPRIRVVLGDAASQETRDRIMAITPRLDIVIDDGSHQSGDIVRCFAQYFPMVSDGGVYVIEDLHCSYWQDFAGGLHYPFSSMAFLKLMADEVNWEHWGTPTSRPALLAAFAKYYGCTFSDAALAAIHSVTFVNSMCIIRKAPSEQNALGVACVVGKIEAIEIGRLAFHGRPPVVPDERCNPWSWRADGTTPEPYPGVVAELAAVGVRRDETPQAMLSALAQRNLAHANELARLRDRTAERDIQLAQLRADRQDLRDELGRTRARVEAMLHSRSWRATAFLRRLMAAGKAARGQFKRGLARVLFDERKYFDTYPDVKASGMSGVQHYLKYGETENRMSAFPRWVQLLRRTRVTVRQVRYRVHNQDGGDVFTTFGKILRSLRTEGPAGVLTRVRRNVSAPSKQASASEAYRNYRSHFEPGPEALEEMRRSVAALGYQPLFSITVPVYNVDAEWLLRFLDSVREQVYPHWELCIADDCSTVAHIRPILEDAMRGDPRIKVAFRTSNGHISTASNTAIELATGEYICLMDNDDEIAAHALYEFAVLLAADPGIDMIYSDEDKLSLSGERYEPFFKPDWSPETLEGCMYTAHFACYRTAIVRRLGGFRTGYDGAQDYDFVLRFTEQTDRIRHVPKVLYHWRAIPGSTASSMDAKDYVLESALRALDDRAQRMGGGKAYLGDFAGSFDLRYVIRGTPKVSIVIPSAGRDAEIRGRKVNLLVNVVRSIRETTSFPDYEIIVVDNRDLADHVVADLERWPCRFVHFDGDFNIATKMNMGASIATGDYLLFMNDDIEVINEDWMECMLQLCQRPGVGVVGARLQFGDGTLQHVGIAFWQGLPDHIRRFASADDPGHFFSSCSNRNYLAVTGAVMMTKRELFESLGGFDERFAINYNDIDYCLKAVAAGQRVVFAAGARLYHYESISRTRTVAQQEIDLFLAKWRERLRHDPYYAVVFDDHPPNFMLRSEFPGLPRQPGSAEQESKGACP